MNLSDCRLVLVVVFLRQQRNTIKLHRVSMQSKINMSVSITGEN